MFSFQSNSGVNHTVHTDLTLSGHNGTVPGNETTPTTTPPEIHVCATDAPVGGLWRSNSKQEKILKN